MEIIPMVILSIVSWIVIQKLSKSDAGKSLSDLVATSVATKEVELLSETSQMLKDNSSSIDDVVAFKIHGRYVVLLNLNAHLTRYSASVTRSKFIDQSIWDYQ